RLRARGLLVILQTALGVVVLVGAGLLLRSFRELRRVPLGFDPEGTLTFRVIPAAARYPTLSARVDLYRRIAEKVEGMRGARSVASISFLPLTFAGRTSGFFVEGQPPPAPGTVPFADFRSVTPGYFRTMSIPFLSGRDLAWSDTPEMPLVAVVSEAMAERYWPSGAVGGRFSFAAPGNA